MESIAPARVPLGSVPANSWRVGRDEVDLSRQVRRPVAVKVSATPQNLTIDLTRTAIIVVDMQNDFCHPDGWLAHIGVDVVPARAPIAPLTALLPVLRRNGVPFAEVP